MFIRGVVYELYSWKVRELFLRMGNVLAPDTSVTKDGSLQSSVQIWLQNYVFSLFSAFYVFSPFLCFLLIRAFFIFGVFSNLILFLVFRASFVKNKIRNIYFGWFPYFLTFELVTYRLLRFVWAPGPFKVLWYLLVFRKLYSYAFLFTLQFLEFWFILFCEYIRN